MTMTISRWLHLHFDKGELTADRGEFGLDRGELAADRGGFGLERWGLENFRLQLRGPRASESARQHRNAHPRIYEHVRVFTSTFDIALGWRSLVSP
jgi:hypothetical protein